jgi:hypothetical protein
MAIFEGSKDRQTRFDGPYFLQLLTHNGDEKPKDGHL